MRELVIVSGKGGTGKTSIAASFALLATSHVMADCDVDAPNLHLLLTPQIEQTEEYIGSKLASINPELCTQCGACEVACHFGAISSDFQVDTIKCEGCGVCQVVCPSEAVETENRLSGYIYTSESDFAPMVHALLFAGEGNSGKLVSEIRKRARELAESTGKDLVLIDGPPGIACPAIAAITGVTTGLVVTEPTVPAIHDLERTLQLFTHFKIPALVLINKYDLNHSKAKEIKTYCRKHDVLVIGMIPYDTIMTEAVVAGHPIVVHAPKHAITEKLRSVWKKIVQELAKHA